MLDDFFELDEEEDLEECFLDELLLFLDEELSFEEPLVFLLLGTGAGCRMGEGTGFGTGAGLENGAGTDKVFLDELLFFFDEELSFEEPLVFLLLGTGAG